MSTRCSHGGSNMTTLRANASPPAAEALIPGGSSNGSRRGPDAAGRPTYRSLRTGAGGGRAALRQQRPTRRTFPALEPLSEPREGKSVVSGLTIGRSRNTLESENDDPEKDIHGRHFHFDKKCVRLERTRTVIPPLPRDYHVRGPGNLHPFSPSKELSHSHAGQPFTLGYPGRYDVNTSPAILFPSTLVISGRNTFSAQSPKLSRPKVNYRTNNLLTVKDNQRGHAYHDPVVGASRSFIHRISELSSLEAETVRQEKLKKMRKLRKPPS